MDYYTATEAARLLGKTEKTVRKWIKSKKLPAVSVLVRGVKQWQVSQDALDAVISNSEDTSNTATIDTGMLSALVARVEELEADTVTSNAKLQACLVLVDYVEALEARVQAVEEYLHTMTAKPPVNVPTAVHVAPVDVASHTRTRTTSISHETWKDMLPLTEAAPLVGLSRRQLSEILKTSDQGQTYHTAIEIETRPGQYNRYMTYDQIESFKDWRSEQKK